MKTYKLAELENRIIKLKEITKVQSQAQKGNYNATEYNTGLANGLIMATAIMDNKEPKYFDVKIKNRRG